ncbi:MAG: glycoside hydrolase family 3 C-terminal domain-containing protein [Oscillospiraceae bacterium]|nr:glycoside hydrolase family 3 C-terminal domain-containing protein [Oscillospiraceae bacterium]
MTNKANKKKRNGWVIALMAVILVIGIVLNTAAVMMKSTFDQFLGSGPRTVIQAGNLDGRYYEQKYETSEAARDAGYAVAERVNAEGSILLKNNGVLPLAADAEVVPLGYAFRSPIYGQSSPSGSAKWADEPVSPYNALNDSSLKLNPEIVNGVTKMRKTIVLTEAEGTRSAKGGQSALGGDFTITEFDPASYKKAPAAPDGTALVFIARGGQEGTDVKFDAYSDGTPHYLALTEAEKGMIAEAKRLCKNVVLIVNSSAPMELGPVVSGELECDAILWIAHPGNNGFVALPKLLTGEINPSGRTVDIWPADFTADPSYQAIGVHRYTNYTVTSGSLTDGGTFNAMYNEYMEGVYMGYRWYETAAVADPDFDYEQAVVFPFGYGLSYTSFGQQLVSLSDDGYTITAKVKVTNTGSVPGKEVVQLYQTAPYTELDARERIEKPAAVLTAFGKTGEIAPGASEEITLTFTWDDLTSYAAYHDNGNGTKGCYMLEEGDYTISVRRDSHTVLDSKALTRSATVWYDGSDDAHIRQTEKDAQSVLDENGKPTGVPMNGRFVAATNLFQTSTDYMNANSTILSRTDWQGTQPAGVAEKAIDESFILKLGLEITFDPKTDARFGNVAGSLVYAEKEPVSGQQNQLKASDLRGRDYDDPLWDMLMDQLDFAADRDNIKGNLSGAGYLTFAVNSIGLPATTDADGANGLKVSDMIEGGSSGYVMSKTATFGMAPLLAATWNIDLMYEFGAALGQEALMHGITGWYSPAINLHRSLFSGRVFEYYSEDPLLSGALAGAAISGCMDNGLAVYLKHFALNETETGRANLVYTWADEQTMRELYLRAFEIPIKTARATIRYYNDEQQPVSRSIRATTAVMAAQTCFGWVSGECSYELLTLLLRNEWGFRGVAHSDYWVWNGDNLRDLALRAGLDTYLCNNAPMWSLQDMDSPTARTAMRRATKNLAYLLVNSNAMQGIAPGAIVQVGTSPWVYWLIAVDVVLALLLAGGVVLLLRRRKQAAA